MHEMVAPQTSADNSLVKGLRAVNVTAWIHRSSWGGRCILFENVVIRLDRFRQIRLTEEGQHLTLDGAERMPSG